MLQSMIKGFNAIILVSSLLMVAAAISYAQPRPHVIGVHVVADPVEHKGECPATITFTGMIRMSGPGTVRYVWLRSDGARVRPASLKFAEAGEQAVTSTWTLGGHGLPHYKGGKAIRILSPNVMTSNRAGFEIHCEAPAGADFENEAIESGTTRRPDTLSGPALPDGWQEIERMPSKQPPLARRQLFRPDLLVAISGPNRAKAGNDIGANIRIKAINRGRAPAPGTHGRIDPDDGYMIDLVISTDARVPVGFATFSASFAEDALLRGGRISNTADLAPGAARAYRAGATIPADTPTGRYFICARIDSGNQVAESNEHNNTDCWPINIIGRK